LAFIPRKKVASFRAESRFFSARKSSFLPREKVAFYRFLPLSSAFFRFLPLSSAF